MYTKVQPVDVLDIKKQQYYVSRIIEGYVMVLVGECVWVCVCVSAPWKWSGQQWKVRLCHMILEKWNHAIAACVFMVCVSHGETGRVSKWARQTGLYLGNV